MPLTRCPVDLIKSADARSAAPGGPQQPAGAGPVRASQLSDDEPLYDSVASDEDYAHLTPLDLDVSILRTPLLTKMYAKGELAPMSEIFKAARRPQKNNR